MRTRIIVVLACAAGLVAAVPYTAPVTGVPKTIVVETTYRFEETEHQKPSPIQLVADQAKVDQTSQEGAAIAFLSALAAGDFDRYLAVHDEVSRVERRAQLERLDASGQVKGGARAAIAAYKDRFKPANKVYLLAQADTPDFSLVAFEVRGPDSTVVYQGILEVKFDGEKWWYSTQNKSHPVKQVWRQDLKNRMQILHQYKNKSIPGKRNNR